LQLQRDSQRGRTTKAKVTDISSDDLLVIKHFREQLKEISEPAVLDVLFLAHVEPITNEDVRSIFKLGRKGTWKRLARLTTLGFLERKRQEYETTEYSRRLVAATSLLFRNAVRGDLSASFDVGGDRNVVADNAITTGLKEILQVARDGNECLHSRGRINDEAHERNRKLIATMETKLTDVPIGT
jgi:hypothetical protein